MKESKKCLVTGAAGFIGSHLVDRLLERGQQVLGVDNMKLGRQSNLASALSHPRFELVEADAADFDRCVAVVGKAMESGPIDAVWHLAANSDIRAGVEDSDVDLRDTFLTTHTTLKWMRRFGIGRIAFASTSAIYGMHPGLLHEDLGPLFPISNYGAMKLASEAALSSGLESFLERVWIFRFPNVVGSRSTHGAIYDFIRKLKANPAELAVLGDGTQEKPYFHVTDLVEAMLYITDRAEEPLNYYNIGTAESASTVRYLAEKVVSRLAPGAVIRYGEGNKGWVGDVPKFNYSIEKLGRLGWYPRWTSNEAVDRAVEEMAAEAGGNS